MKIALTIPEFGPSAGGVGSVVYSLANQLSKLDDFDVTAVDLAGSAAFKSEINTRRCRNLGMGFSWEMLSHLSHGSYDIIHQHGVWHPISAASLGGITSSAAAMVCSPHGMLEPWILSRGRLKKSIAKLLYEKRLWNKTRCFHALTPSEAASIKAIASKETGVFYIPNGVEINVEAELNSHSKKIILFFGRFHEKKGIKPMLRAWSRLGAARNGYTLRLIGWGDDDQVAGADEIEGVEILPPVFDHQLRDQLLREADFLILPSFSEGLPMAVLEAWAQGTPAILTAECNLPAGFESGAALEIRPEEESILEGLKRAIGLSEAARLEMANASRTLCGELYSIQTMIERMTRMYQWALGIPVSVDDIKI